MLASLAVDAALTVFNYAIIHKSVIMFQQVRAAKS